MHKSYLKTGFYLHIFFTKDLPSDKPNSGRNHHIQTKEWRAEIKPFSQTKILRFDKQNAVAILYGELFTRKIDENFIPFFRKKPLHTARELNGSWALLFFDLESGCIKTITDRVNSRPLYLYKTASSQEIIISSSLEHFPKRLRHPDWIGVGWKLTNGVLHCSRTIFKDTIKLDRSSIYTITPQSVKHEKYWKLEFTENLSHKSEELLIKDFSDVLTESIKRRIPEERPAVLSLSGGTDSPLILGVLANELKSDELICFSYELPKSRKDSDASVAKYLAQKEGFPHKLVSSFDGNILETISLNASYGSGISNFCDEAVAWKKSVEMFPKQFPHFFGDCFFGWKKRPYKTVEDVIRFSKLRNSKGLSRFSGILPEKLLQNMKHGIESDRNNLVKQITESKIENIRDFLFLDQRINNFLIPWRVFFWGRGCSMKLPLLDNDILDFVRNLSPEHRTHKQLYRKTFKAMLPPHYSAQKAKSENYVPNHKKELNLNREVLIQILSSHINDPLSQEWHYESFVRFVSAYFNRPPGKVLKRSVRETIKKVDRKFPKAKYHLKKQFPLELNQTVLVLNVLSLLGFVFDIDFKKQ